MASHVVNQTSMLQIADVLFVKVPSKLSKEQKQGLMEWFIGQLKGTVLEHHRVLLLDEGIDVEQFQAPMT